MILRLIGRGGIETDDEVLVLHEASLVPAWLDELREGRGRVTSVRAWQRRDAPRLETQADLVVVDSATSVDLVGEDERLRSLAVVAPHGLKTAGLQVSGVAAAASAEALCDAVLAALRP